MPKSIPEPEKIRRIAAYEACNQVTTHAATMLGIPRKTLHNSIQLMLSNGDYDRLRESARSMGINRGFAVEPLPDPTCPIEEILERRKAEYKRTADYHESRNLVKVEIEVDGPYGIAHFGDTHLDDPGTDISLVEEHMNIINDTEGLFGASVGDHANNWVGRLARLYAEQGTTAAEGIRLVEWFISGVSWLYLIGGNHDLWLGAGDPIPWFARQQGAIYEADGVRLNLVSPCGTATRVNGRHDFSGHSQWNPTHGVAKAAMMGWRDHILTCGHKHISGYQVVKCPATGLISHAIRVAGYKFHDRYAKELGLPNQNVSPTFTTVVDPRYEDHDPRRITTLFDVATAARYLTMLRSEFIGAGGSRGRKKR